MSSVNTWRGRLRPSRLGAGLVLAGAVALLSGCASTLTTRVVSFQQWPSDSLGKTYQFSAPNALQANNLQYAAYQDVVRASLSSVGLVPAAAGTPPRFDVQFDYTWTPTQRWVMQPVGPYWGGPWPGPRGRGAFWPGPYGPGPYWGGPYPYYYGWGPSAVDVPYPAIRADLMVRILDDSQGGQEVYRSNAATVLDRQSDLTMAFPYLVRAMFSDFPGNNGQVHKVRYTVGQ